MLLADVIAPLINITEWLAIASLKTIPLIVLVLLAQQLFRKQLSAASRHLLWLSVLLSLSIPFGWNINLGNFSNVYSAPARVDSTPSSVNSNNQHGFMLAEAEAVNTLTTNNIAAQNNSAIHSSNTLWDKAWVATTQHYRLLLAIFWLLGAIAFFGLTLIQARHFYRIKAQACAVSPNTFSLFNACKRELGINKSIQLLSTRDIPSPITLGWLKPAVMLPHTIEQQLTPETLKHVLLHELGHIKRQDIFFNWLACLINILHWFNPIVWFACRRMRLDMEIACDALVLSHLHQTQRKNYGTSLIEVSETPRNFSQTNIMFNATTTLGILENHQELKQRLTMIKEFTTMNIKNSILFGIILTATAITALAQPNTSRSDNTATAPAEKVSAIKSEDYIDLKEFAKIAEKDLKTRVLVGQNDAQKIIQVNLGNEPLNYGQFLTQLKINEYTAYKSKDYIQIVAMREARYLSIPIVEKNKTYYEDEVVTDYLKTEKSCAGKVLATVRPLVPQYAHLSTYEDSHTLIIIDTYGNIQRIKGVIDSIEASLTTAQDCKKITPVANRSNPNSKPIK